MHECSRYAKLYFLTNLSIVVKPITKWPNGPECYSLLTQKRRSKAPYCPALRGQL